MIVEVPAHSRWGGRFKTRGQWDLDGKELSAKKRRGRKEPTNDRLVQADEMTSTEGRESDNSEPSWLALACTHSSWQAQDPHWSLQSVNRGGEAKGR